MNHGWLVCCKQRVVSLQKKEMHSTSNNPRDIHMYPTCIENKNAYTIVVGRVADQRENLGKLLRTSNYLTLTDELTLFNSVPR